MSRPTTLKKALPGLGRVVHYFSPYLRKEWRLIALSFLALFAEVAFRLLEPWPLKIIFDYVIPIRSSAPRSEIPALNTLDPATLLALAAVAVVTISFLRALASYWNSVGFALVGNRVVTKVRDKLFRHMQRLSLSFYTQARGGDLTVRVISDVGQLRDVAVTAVLPLLGNVFVLTGMVGVMFWLNWRLTLLALAVTPLFWLFSLRLSKRIQRASRKQRQREGAVASTTAESIGAIKIIQAFSLQRVFSQVFSSHNKKSMRDGVKTSKLAASLERTVDVIIAIATALVLWFGANLVVSGSLTPGDLLIFLFYLKGAFKPVQDFAKYTGRLAKASASGERVIELLEREPDVQDLPGAIHAHRLRGAVRFEHVSFAYEQDHNVLHDVNFEVEPGQRVALVGPSGSGKSTISNLIPRFYDPTEGRILLDGRDIREYTLESVRGQMSIVLQESLLFAASVRDNIAYGASDYIVTDSRPVGKGDRGEGTQVSDAEIRAAARLANAHNFIKALPHGYDTLLSERGMNLSGGQKQRIAIARAAIRKAPILILDEPTTGLDEENSQEVVEALERLVQGHTTFLISHDLELAARSDLILYLEDGRIIERGSHQDLMRQNGRYAALYKMQTMAEQMGLDQQELHVISA